MPIECFSCNIIIALAINLFLNWRDGTSLQIWSKDSSTVTKSEISLSINVIIESFVWLRSSETKTADVNWLLFQ